MSGNYFLDHASIEEIRTELLTCQNEYYLRKYGELFDRYIYQNDHIVNTTQLSLQ